MRHWILAVMLCAAGLTHAGDTIWSGVVLATPEKGGPKVPPRLQDFAPTIQRIFGYNSLYLLGEKRFDLHDGISDWLVPSKRIFMKVTVLDTLPSRYRLQVELYDGTTLLVTTEAELARDAPLYIRGPQWGKGQLVAILEVR